MSHPITFGNGCTLEDCHTNLFALTDLDGIKWRKLTAENTCFTDPLEDPVLQSFTRCIKSDVLCVWRRVQSSGSSEQKVTDQLSNGKELWIFWYGDEPHNLSNLLSHELQEKDQGSWTNGLSYECRTLLYKALHNLIERCLMSQNFIRIGKWFVQPYHHYGNCNPDKSAHLSIQFSFFLHGESTVCSSIDVRQHPPLCRMHLQYLAYAQQMAAPPQGAVSGVPVILAPYGLAATLTGQSFRETDAATQRLLDDWRQFYMIKDPEGSEASKVPSVVEVIVAGVRMRYPSSFVLVTADTDNEIMRQQMSMTTMLPGSGTVPRKLSVTIGTPSSSPVDIELPCKLECGSSALQPLMEESGAAAVSRRIMEKVWEDCVCCSGQYSQQSRHHQQQLQQQQQQQQQQQANGTTIEDAAAIGIWEFAEPLQRNTCLCCKSKFKQRAANTSHSKPGVPFMGKHTAPEKGEKAEKGRHAARSMASFHQRVAHNVDMIRHDVDASMDTMSVSLQKGAVNAHAGGNLPPLRNGIFEQQGVDSPHSAAPSPLMASQIQPSVSHNGDPTMPTLSPHPPLKHGDKEGSMGPGDLHEAGLATTTVVAPAQQADMSNKAPTPGDPKPESFLSPPYSNGTADGGVCAKTENVDRWLEVQPQQRQQALLLQQHQQQRRHAEFSLLKRPLLPTNSYDDDTELVTNSLYDFKALDSWLQHSVKRPKQEPDLGSKSAQSPGGHQFGSKRQDNTPSPQLQPHDPYEFSDEASSNAGSFRKRGFRNSRDDSFPRSSPFTSRQDDDARRNSDASGNFKEFNKSSSDVSPPSPDSAAAAAPISSLIRDKDLVPTLDIPPEQLFASESDNSDSEALQVPSPGTCIVKMTEDVAKTANKMTLSSAAMMGPSVTELSRMFPTPPSLENQQNALSPCQAADMTDITAVYAMPPTVMTDVDSARTEAFHSTMNTGHSEDWSYVYKPPTVNLFVRAEKYAPITLPSARQPSLGVEGLLYKPSCQPFHMPVMEKHPQPPQHYTNVPSVDNISSVGSVPRSHTDRPEMSPAAAGFGGSQQRTPRTPMSYELQSPASNASSYLNKNMSSVDNHPTNSQLPEVHSLVTNVMLSDSILNLFKDHNFNSCTICVCNMNIDGTDVGLYLPHTSSEPQYKCTCGFSAVMNRKCGVNSGLFYEDEVDITGIRDERLEHRKSSLLAAEQGKDTVLPNRTSGNAVGATAASAEVVPQDIMALLQSQFSTLYPSCTVLHNYRKTHTAIEHMPSDQVNKLEIQDGCNVCYGALEIGRQAVDNCNSTRLEDILLKDTCLHKWPYLTTAAKVPNNSQDMVRLLKSLQPLLQDAIRRMMSCRLWEAVYTITGPLSWKDFHLLSGRGSDETSEPQPIPPLLLGCDREWLTLDPHAIRYWDKLMLEPHGRARNIAYVVVAPDNDHVLQCTKAFFKELTNMYELCRLGQHRPISKVLRDGVMRVGKTAATKLSEEPVDDWFKLIGNSPSAAKLKLYARVCQHHLAPFLTQEIVDKKLQSDSGRDTSSKVTSSHQSAASPAPQSHVSGDRSQPPHPGSLFPSQQYSHSEEKTGETHDTRHPTHRESDLETEQDAADGPAVLVYMVDPFSYASDADDLRRLAMLGLLRCYNEMLKTLPAHVHHNVHLQIVPLQAVLEFGETPSQQYMKGLALSVYTQCRRLLVQSLFGRPLTSFGPAAGNSKVLKSDPNGRLTNMRLYMPPFTLAVNRNVQASQLAISDHQDNCGVLLCGYCLSEDQRWLLAVCTDSVGSILETRTINIDIPNRNRRKNVSARKIGLSKLWDFLLGVMSTTTLSWRLVIGRFGRLGHGELKGWAGLLSRKHLQQGCKQLREMCVMCGMAGNNDAPYIVSACLVSLEVHPTIHIMTDSVKVEEKQSSDCPMSTPKDASCTHILVFPTSALAQANQPVNHQEHPIDLSTEDIFQGLDELDAEDIFSSLTDPDGSPKNNSAPGSPSHAAGGGMPMMNGASKSKSLSDIQDEEHNLLQQPLAMGFYVSTASTGPLPKWFWGQCPEREDVCPTCFKAALHIHCPAAQQNPDEFLQTPHKHNHPLDSSLTCDVLRYVLEMYNALSWLTIDPMTDDRRSCLPAHLVVLMQLYHAVRSFV